jgi:hypothetical protein
VAGEATAWLEYVRFAAVISVAAAVVHASVAPAHFGEGMLFGVLFVVAAQLQAGWAWLSWAGPSRRVLVAGAALNVGVALVWLWSRTTGLPVGPEAWEPEPVGLLDVQASVDEILVAVLIAYALWPPRRGWWRPVTYATETLVLVSLLGSFVLPAAGFGHAH